jgi:hypothetical protein
MCPETILSQNLLSNKPSKPKSHHSDPVPKQQKTQTFKLKSSSNHFLFTKKGAPKKAMENPETVATSKLRIAKLLLIFSLKNSTTAPCMSSQKRQKERSVKYISFTSIQNVNLFTKLLSISRNLLFKFYYDLL